MYYLLSTGAAEPSMTSIMLQNILVFGVVIAIMYFMLIAPQKKREKKLQDIRNSLEIGDGVTTQGGIVGRVVSIKEDTVVIESAGAKVRFKRWAVADVEKLSVE